jgi:hypothetical protein
MSKGRRKNLVIKALRRASTPADAVATTALGLALGLIVQAMEIKTLEDFEAWKEAVTPVVTEIEKRAAALGVQPTEIKSIK